MTEQDWAPLAREISRIFRGDFTPEDARSYYRYLSTLSADEVAGALLLLVHEGQVFVPAAGEIATRARKVRMASATGDVEPPTWEQALDMIRRAIRRFGREEQEALEGLYGRHPLYGLFAQRHGWQRLYHEAIDDLDVGHAVRKRLQEEWDRMVEEQMGKVQAGQAFGQLREMTGRELPRGLRQMAPAGLLGPSDGPANVGDTPTKD